MRNREILCRQFRIVHELCTHPNGLSSEKLAQRVGASRATINRDLDLLRNKVGLPIERSRKTGEVWHRLREMPIASISATPIQLAALHLAREALRSLRGTALLDQLDALLAAVTGKPAPLSSIDFVGRPQRDTIQIVRVIDLAITDNHRIVINTKVAARGGEEKKYTLDPLRLRLVDDDLYLIGWSLERKNVRTFKVARIREVTLSSERGEPHPDVNIDEVFRGSVKAWSGELTRVRVRIRPEVAWLVEEYPLVATQVVTSERDGGALITADVAGLVEAVRWVLSWGRNAEALEPAALRDAVERELTLSLAAYGSKDVRSTKVSRPRARPSSQSRHLRA